MDYDIEDFQDSLESIEDIIDMEIEEISHPYIKCKNFGRKLWTLVDMYRGRAILKYLLQADINSFFKDLNREALTYTTLLKAYHEGYDIDASRFNGSTPNPIYCAIAASNIQLAQKIDKLLPGKMGNYDGEELFAFTMLIRSLTRQDLKAAGDDLLKVQKECKGFLRYDPKIAAVEGIVKKDSELFNQGLESYLETFDTMSYAEAIEMDPGDESIDIESLALIQLAKKYEIPIKFKHGMIPAELQEPLLILPETGYPKWPG